MNERDVRLTYRMLKHKNETNVRLVDPYGKLETINTFVRNERDFVDVCDRFDGHRNIYVGVNERSPSGTKSADVKTVNMIVLDIDSYHPRDSPSTTEETQKALVVAKEVMAYLLIQNRHPYLAMSGNGWQIWCPVYIELNSDNRRKVECAIKELQRSFIQSFSNGIAKIDNIGDLGRVVKVIGTKSIKPKEEVNRTNRYSYWYTQPIYVVPDVVWSEKLLKLALETEWKTYDEEIIKQIRIGEDEVGMYMGLFTPKMLDLFNGDWKKHGYKSRSEAEMALTTFIATCNIPKEHVSSIMELSKIGKWNESNGAYRQKTISKAYVFSNER